MTFREFIRGATRYVEVGYERGYKDGFARAEAIARGEGMAGRQGMLVADYKAMQDGMWALSREVEAAVLSEANKMADDRQVESFRERYVEGPKRRRQLNKIPPSS